MNVDDFRLQELTEGGDTQLHYHLADRATNASLQGQERVTAVSAAYTATYDDDVLLITANSPFTVTLPLARSRRITLVRVVGASTVTVARTSTDTINGATSVSITASYTPLTLKAVAGVGYIGV
jgi:hypothetical protein